MDAHCSRLNVQTEERVVEEFIKAFRPERFILEVVLTSINLNNHQRTNLSSCLIIYITYLSLSLSLSLSACVCVRCRRKISIRKTVKVPVEVDFPGTLIKINSMLG